ncbi:MAG: hypothetical protein J6X87_05510 [Clostridia bacterium]|nr:hypothetical protein [Clostridia bacterium]
MRNSKHVTVNSRYTEKETKTVEQDRDTVVQETTEKKERVALGILGAFLFSLAGAAVWVLLDIVGFLAALSGLVGVFCAIQGYRIFSGKLTKRGVIISVVVAFLVLVGAWYCCMARDMMLAYREMYEAGEIAAPITYATALLNAWRALGDKQMLLAYGGSLLLGLGFAVLGSFAFIKKALGQANAQKEAEKAAGAQVIPQELTPEAKAAIEAYEAKARRASGEYGEEAEEAVNIPEAVDEAAHEAAHEGATEAGEIHEAAAANSEQIKHEWQELLKDQDPVEKE